jgi:hypothetical protein
MWEYAAIIFILGVAGYWILQPLLTPKGLESGSPQSRAVKDKALEKSKEDVYAAIKEMEMDFGMGKISEEDYQDLKSRYKSKALHILKELDGVEGGEDVDAAIEREVRQLRMEKEPESEKRHEKETALQLNFCPQCGKKVGPSDNFCHGCGMKFSHVRGRV